MRYATGNQFDDCPYKYYTLELLLRKLSIIFNAGPEMPIPLCLYINPSCQTLSKVFDMSKKYQKRRIWLFKCSKTVWKNIYIFKKKNKYDFYKNFIFLNKNLFFFQIKLCIQSKYLYPLSKKLILLKKKIHFVKIFILFKQTHSVKDGFYFQFSFVTNEQV